MSMIAPENDPIYLSIFDAVDAGSIATVKGLLAEHPDALNVYKGSETYLHRAARNDNLELMEYFLDAGIDVNVASRGTWGPPIMSAICYGSPRGVGFLLSHGADPNGDRALIAAINHDSLEIVKLLVEHGVDINRVFPWGEDEKLHFTPLSWAIFSGKSDIADYLRSKGATMPPEETDPGPPTLDDQIIAYFANKLGPVQPQSQQEIVPTGLPIAIHVVPPSEGRNHITLFTTGMSQQPMTVPVGAERLQYAELAINVPADWPLPGLPAKSRALFGWLGKGTQERDPAAGLWPFHWLRTIARYSHENNTWLGGAAVIFANGDPPQPLAPGVPFTSLLMMNIDEVTVDGRTVQIYQLLPLYTEERALEMADGTPALLQALDRNNISWVVDLNRPNVATLAK
jgi:hypothetical protein